MCTSLLMVALVVAPRLAAPERPVWLTSYATALDVGQKYGRPVAVFVGSGPQGQAALVKEGQFSPEQLQVLAQKYVCVYLDRAQEPNQRLVRDFGINLAGVVISDRTGDYQAFHHDGAIAQADLTQRLSHFGSPGLVVSTTVSNTVQRTSNYRAPSTTAPQSIRTVNC